MTVFLPNSTKLLGRRNDQLSSNLGIAALKRFVPETDLVNDQNVEGPDGNLKGEKTINYNWHHNLSAQQDTNKSFLERDINIHAWTEEDAARNRVALPKTKNGFF